MHVAEMEALRAGMPAVFVNHDGGGGGPTIRDIHMENFSVTVGGRDLILDASITLSFGRHYGEIISHIISFLPVHLWTLACKFSWHGLGELFC